MKFLFGVFFFVCWFSNAQSHSYFRSEYRGNSSVLGNIRDMAYDESGFLWVAGQASEVVWGMFTDRGAVLQRFDGDRFHDIPVPNFSFPVEHISQISAMENGKFYLRCVSKEGVGLLVLDPITVTFKSVVFPEKIDKRKLDFSNVYHYEGRDYVFVKNNANIVLY
ncbi:MAG TPA: hypothetical protein VFM82_09460, partial [Flavobacteriaceae bacterium]|nr:hypothetical protein [Flavobacteriaceae bacterium]